MMQKSAGVVHGGRVACSGGSDGSTSCSGSVSVVLVLLPLPRRDGKPWFSHQDENREADTITSTEGRRRIEIVMTIRKCRRFMLIWSFFL